MSKFKVGDRVRFVERGYNERQRVGAEATVIALDEDGDAILDTDMPGEAIGWANVIEVIHRPGDAPAITPLDDAGRAALKAGDRVLVEVVIVSGPDGDGEFEGKTGGVRAPGMTLPPYFVPSAVYALLPPASKPIAAGDTVRQARPKLHGVTFDVLASVDGHLLLRDQRDGHVSTGEAKDFEVVS